MVIMLLINSFTNFSCSFFNFCLIFTQFSFFKSFKNYQILNLLMNQPAGLICPPLILPETSIPIITPKPPDKHPDPNKFIIKNISF